MGDLTLWMTIAPFVLEDAHKRAYASAPSPENKSAPLIRGGWAIPEGSMRVGPGTDAVVWRTCPTHKATP